MDSQAETCGCELGKGEKIFDVGDAGVCGMDEQGHASPNDTPSMAVREAGQMGASPVINTFHRTGSTTMGMEEACVVGCDKR